jgi:hypothetical protein
MAPEASYASVKCFCPQKVSAPVLIFALPLPVLVKALSLVSMTTRPIYWSADSVHGVIFIDDAQRKT